MTERKNRFSIRKLIIGAVSVMFGALLLTLSSNSAHADSTDSNAKIEQHVTGTDEDKAEENNAESIKAAATTQAAKAAKTSVKAAAAGVSSKQAKAALPQTGAKKTEAAAAGLALAAVAGILGLAGKKRKHN